MHGDVSLGGPVYVGIIAALFSAAMFAIFVLLDSARPKRWRGVGGPPETLWPYRVLYAFWLLLMIAGQFPSVPVRVTLIVIITWPLAIIAGFAYLLRVVFPKSRPGAAIVDSVDEPTAETSLENEESVDR